MNPFDYHLYLVTDENACLGRDLLWVVEEAVKGGVDIVQLREKQMDSAAFITRACRLKALLDKYNVPLIINDNLPVAIAADAHGIHVGNSDMPPVTVRSKWNDTAILGYSIEYEAQLGTAHAAVADYLALSPVFSTTTKTDTVTEWGLEGVARIRQLTGKPLVAIGNISADNAGAIIQAGADCLAVVSAICSAASPAKAAEALREKIIQHKS
ncbi:thiamine-phosphate diphosphorylase [Filimonas lacunae]|uniref:Thiamine-phosphate synthase n=1 Tax=Filimonas lacunae TaxID=477680 RepID=A0A173MCF1_9BACT|nr:thiamine phosphate synthase [Filimonas lacunae]BAV05138.1 thiamin-phosphate pyrophosphorylase [Filimonas lacunae]SIT34168.1 thiamine-phosphate diphosphorylase [Filimonas lacunae]